MMISEATLVKVDKNGTKYYEQVCTCGKCNGTGIIGYYIPINGGECFSCNGSGVHLNKWKEMTPEYEARLNARRERKAQREEEERKEKWWEDHGDWFCDYAHHQCKLAEEKEQREAEEKERKAISQYVGEIGERISVKATYLGSASFERECYVHSYYRDNTEIAYVHKFVSNGNQMVWITATPVNVESGSEITLVGTVKEHKEYKDEKQTTLSRVRIK